MSNDAIQVADDAIEAARTILSGWGADFIRDIWAAHQESQFSQDPGLQVNSYVGGPLVIGDPMAMAMQAQAQIQAQALVGVPSTQPSPVASVETNQATENAFSVLTNLHENYIKEAEGRVAADQDIVSVLATENDSLRCELRDRKEVAARHVVAMQNVISVLMAENNSLRHELRDLKDNARKLSAIVNKGEFSTDNLQVRATETWTKLWPEPSVPVGFGDADTTPAPVPPVQPSKPAIAAQALALRPSQVGVRLP